ncbi:Mevalonate kinase [Plasmodiophora brassicae]|nr:hypothetical protein PBRA_001149 [Plasmodiophora brassicae]
MAAVEVHVPCKVIVSGEHAVVYGAPAYAVAISRGTRVRASVAAGGDRQHHCLRLQRLSRTVRLRLDLSRCDAHDSDEPTPESVAVRVFAFLVKEVGIASGVSVDVDSEVPLGGGLGSSASFCAALACALLHIAHPGTIVDDAHRIAVQSLALAAERIVHGTPSGVDTFVVVYGGAVLYRKTEKPTRMSPIPLRFVIVDTKVPRSTKAMVERVAEFRNAHDAVVNPIIDAISALTTTIVDSGKMGGQLVAANHHLLCALGVGHSAIDQVVQIGARLGVPCKLTGAGGGGCVIAVLPDDDDGSAFIGECDRAGFDAFPAVPSEAGLTAHYLPDTQPLQRY